MNNAVIYVCMYVQSVFITLEYSLMITVCKALLYFLRKVEIPNSRINIPITYLNKIEQRMWVYIFVEKEKTHNIMYYIIKGHHKKVEDLHISEFRTHIVRITALNIKFEYPGSSSTPGLSYAKIDCRFWINMVETPVIKRSFTYVCTTGV